ncbi:MAG TPA: AMP-binding protein, partial [Burkholderiales bacterium]|nr:AMP-binding protein [Burkholderiales bacterium]
MTQLLQHLVERQAARRPEATAIVYGAKRLSYGELDAAANRLARALVEAGCRKGDRVCFLYPKKPAAMVWMLGILKAGAMHVPLDLASPAERLRRIVTSCEPRFILAAGPAASLALQLQDLSKICWIEQTIPGGLRPAFTLKDV